MRPLPGRRGPGGAREAAEAADPGPAGPSGRPAAPRPPARPGGPGRDARVARREAGAGGGPAAAAGAGLPAGPIQGRALQQEGAGGAGGGGPCGGQVAGLQDWLVERAGPDCRWALVTPWGVLVVAAVAAAVLLAACCCARRRKRTRAGGHGGGPQAAGAAEKAAAEGRPGANGAGPGPAAAAGLPPLRAGPPPPAPRPAPPPAANGHGSLLEAPVLFRDAAMPADVTSKQGLSMQDWLQSLSPSDSQFLKHFIKAKKQDNAMSKPPERPVRRVLFGGARTPKIVPSATGVWDRTPAKKKKTKLNPIEWGRLSAEKEKAAKATAAEAKAAEGKAAEGKAAEAKAAEAKAAERKAATATAEAPPTPGPAAAVAEEPSPTPSRARSLFSISRLWGRKGTPAKAAAPAPEPEPDKAEKALTPSKTVPRQVPKVGDRCVLHNLQSRADANGQRCEVTKETVGKNGDPRYIVQLIAAGTEGELLNVKASHLLVLPYQQKVREQKPGAAPAAEGAAEGPGAAPAAAGAPAGPPRVGDRCVLENLQSRPEYNGKLVEVTKETEGKGGGPRYIVQVGGAGTDGELLNVKEKHLRIESHATEGVAFLPFRGHRPRAAEKGAAEKKTVTFSPHREEKRYVPDRRVEEGSGLSGGGRSPGAFKESDSPPDTPGLKDPRGRTPDRLPPLKSPR